MLSNVHSAHSTGQYHCTWDALGTDAASLLVRDPSDPDGIWSIWDHATERQRRQLVDIARTLLRAS